MLPEGAQEVAPRVAWYEGSFCKRQGLPTFRTMERSLVPAYLIASVVGVKDAEALGAYLEASPALIAAHGGK